mmetsp:Transcript_812/g.3373  ORF Transcript_812/g.3373 Transcript_812/m.3373 type:complete len:237 (-) Transcript_812:1862-2572(-)
MRHAGIISGSASASAFSSAGASAAKPGTYEKSISRGITPSASAAPLLAAGFWSSLRTVASFTISLLAPAAGFDPTMYEAANSPIADTAESRMSTVGCLKFSSSEARSVERKDLGPVVGPGPLSNGCETDARHCTYLLTAARITSPPLPRYRRAFSIAVTRPVTFVASSPSTQGSPAFLSASKASAAPTHAPCLASRFVDSDRSNNTGSATSRIHSGSRRPMIEIVLAASSLVARSQ